MSAISEWHAAWNCLGNPAWSCLGPPSPPAGLLEQLVAAYAEPHRSYHGRRHLDECFDRLELVRPLLQEPAEVALALWFHDAVYDPTRADNELRSAEWANRAIEAAGGLEETMWVVADLIMATAHDAPPATTDERCLVDVDLAILGADPARFDEYEAQIRREYAFVAEDAFRAGRARILRSFLDRPSIYATEPCRDLLEARARANIERSLHRLAAPG